MSKPIEPGSLIELTIEKLTVGGAGIGRFNTLAVFVPYSAPGDHLQVRITAFKKTFAEAEIVHVLTPSQHRQKAPCEYFQSCGGCHWQHLPHEEQLRQKKILLQESFAKLFKHPLTVSLPDVIPSSRTYNYRNRAQPILKNGHLGFRRRHSHDFLAIQNCLLLEEPLQELWKNWKSKLKTKSPDRDEQRVELLLTEQGETSIRAFENQFEANGFSQVNRYQNKDLIDYVLRCLKSSNFQSVYDLYCGSGNFSFPISQQHPQVPLIGVELSSLLVSRARERAQTQPCLRFIESDVALYLKRNLISSESAVVLDPPRDGADPFVIQTLAAAPIKKLIYISCHPVALARDLSLFFDTAKILKRDVKILKIQAFEMFPQTDHFETIVDLSIDTEP